MRTSEVGRFAGGRANFLAVMKRVCFDEGMLEVSWALGYYVQASTGKDALLAKGSVEAPLVCLIAPHTFVFLHNAAYGIQREIAHGL
eukprot:1138374-Pelagomonas_calceolata.AAC.2